MSTLYLPAMDEQGVQRQLAALDDRLILTRERDQRGRDFYVVIYYQGGSLPPEVIEDWREYDGTPKPLNSALVYTIQQRMSTGGASLADVLGHNAKLKEAHEREMAEVYEERARDVARFERSSSPPVRSHGLYLSRQKERERRRRSGR